MNGSEYLDKKLDGANAARDPKELEHMSSLCVIQFHVEPNELEN